MMYVPHVWLKLINLNKLYKFYFFTKKILVSLKN